MGSDACAQIIELTSNMDNNQQMYDDPQIFSKHKWKKWYQQGLVRILVQARKNSSEPSETNIYLGTPLS